MIEGIRVHLGWRLSAPQTRPSKLVGVDVAEDDRALFSRPGGGKAESGKRVRPEASKEEVPTKIPTGALGAPSNGPIIALNSMKINGRGERI